MYYVENGTVENSVELTGKMSKRQFSYFAQKFAAYAMSIAERKGWGLGEVMFYVRQDGGGLVESDIATEREARAICSEAEELMFKAEEIRATLNEPSYWEHMENERDIATGDVHDYQWEEGDE